MAGTVSTKGKFDPSKDYIIESERASPFQWRKIEVEKAVVLDLLEYTTTTPKKRGAIREKLQEEAKELQALLKSIDEVFGYQTGGGSGGGYFYNPYPIGFEYIQENSRNGGYEITIAALLAKNDGTLAWPMLTVYRDGSIKIVESDKVTVRRLLACWTHDYGKSDSTPLTDEQILQYIKTQADDWKARRAEVQRLRQEQKARQERVRGAIRRMPSPDRAALLGTLQEWRGVDHIVELLRQTV